MYWDESLHPRATKGSPRGGEWVSAGVLAARAWEADAAGAAAEHAQAFDQNGNALLPGDGKTSGKTKAVFFGPDDLMRMAQRDAVFTHNHPGKTSLSKEDIDLALMLNVREMRAVAGDRVYVMRRNGERWGFGGGKSLDTYNKHARRLAPRFADRAALTHAVMTATADELGFYYAAHQRPN